MNAPVYAFELGIVGQAPTRVMNARSSGKAKYLYLLDVRDYWPDVTFMDLFARRIGPPVTSEAFKRTAAYRGLPELRCGQAVEVKIGREPGVARGVIVGHNESANFEVLFDDDSPHFAGLTLNVHPGDFVR